MILSHDTQRQIQPIKKGFQVKCVSLAGAGIHGSGGEDYCKEDAAVQTGLKLVYLTVI